MSSPNIQRSLNRSCARYSYLTSSPAEAKEPPDRSLYTRDSLGPIRPFAHSPIRPLPHLEKRSIATNLSRDGLGDPKRGRNCGLAPTIVGHLSLAVEWRCGDDYVKVPRHALNGTRDSSSAEGDRFLRGTVEIKLSASTWPLGGRRSAWRPSHHRPKIFPAGGD